MTASYIARCEIFQSSDRVRCVKHIRLGCRSKVSLILRRGFSGAMKSQLVRQAGSNNAVNGALVLSNSHPCMGTVSHTCWPLLYLGTPFHFSVLKFLFSTAKNSFHLAKTYLISDKMDHAYGYLKTLLQRSFVNENFDRYKHETNRTYQSEYPLLLRDLRIL